MNDRLVIARRALIFALLLPGVIVSADDLRIEGQVTTPGGEPGIGARVWLLQNDTVYVGDTSEEGRYQFAGLTEGPVNLVVLADGFGVNGFETYLIESIDNANVILPPASEFRVRVINRRSEPIAGARLKELHINQLFHVYCEQLAPHGFPSFRSDAEGFLEVPIVPAGTANGVRIDHRRYAEDEIPAIPVDVEIDFPLPDGVRVVGRITDPDGNGVANARVSIFRPLERGTLEVAETRATAEGFYSAHVPAGRYAVTARHTNWAIAAPVPIECTGTDDVTADLTLPQPVELSGRVVDTQGNPIPWVGVASRMNNTVVAERYTNRDGAYTLTVPPGNGAVRVIPPPGAVTDGYPEQTFETRELDRIELVPFTLKPLPVVEGRVALDESDGGAYVRTLNVDPPLFALADNEGKFALRLQRAQFDEPVRLRVESASRFERTDFEFNVLEPEIFDLKMSRFRPSLPKEDDPLPNNLNHMIGDPAPEWTCDAWLNVPVTAEGEAQGPTLESLRGKIVVLTFWGGFDRGPTRDRMREMNVLHKLLGDEDDVAFIGIHDASYEPSQVERLVYELNIPYPVGCDADPFLTFDTYNINVIPHTVLIDKRGVLRHVATDGRILELIKDLRRR